MNNAPIFIIDDDLEELEIVQEIWQELGFENSLEVFSNIDDMLFRLVQEDTTPFLIISEVHLPGMSGLDLCEKLAKDPVIKNKNIPFLLWSIASSKETIKRANDCGGHGFFLKGRDWNAIKDSLQMIVNYWNASQRPNFSKVIPLNYQKYYV